MQQQQNQQPQQATEKFDLQELGKIFMSDVKQKVGHALTPLSTAAVACFYEVGSRCEKVLGFLVAHAIGSGAEANEAVLNGFKKDIAAQFRKGAALISKLQDTHRQNEMNAMKEKQINKVYAILGNLDNGTLKDQGKEITENMSNALAKAFEDASQKAKAENGLFTKEIRDQLKENILKITKDARSKAWGLRGTDVMLERVVAIGEKVENSSLSKEHKQIAKQAITSNCNRFTNDQQERAGELNRGEIRFAKNAGKDMEEEVGRMMEVLVRIEKLEDEANKINDDGIKGLVGQLRTSLAKKNEDSYFSRQEFQEMQKELDKARSRIMIFQVRGNLAEGFQKVAQKIQITSEELNSPVGITREVKTETAEIVIPQLPSPKDE